MNSRAWRAKPKVHGDVVVRRLLDNPQDIIVLDLDELHGMAPGEGREIELAVLFSDIRNFTAHSEMHLPYDVVPMLNRHFTAVAEPILNNNGFIWGRGSSRIRHARRISIGHVSERSAGSARDAECYR